MLKPIVKPKTYSTIDAYNLYIKNLVKANPTYAIKNPNGKTRIVKDAKGNIVSTYQEFKSVVSLFNKKAGKKLKLGFSIDLLNGLGYLFIIRIERNPNKLRLNKGASYKLRKELEANGTLTKNNWLVYHADEFYIKLQWYKIAFSYINKQNTEDLRLYAFKAAGGNNGYRQSMGRELVTNKGLAGLYPYVTRDQINKK